MVLVGQDVQNCVVYYNSKLICTKYKRRYDGRNKIINKSLCTKLKVCQLLQNRYTTAKDEIKVSPISHMKPTKMKNLK